MIKILKSIKPLLTSAILIISFSLSAEEVSNDLAQPSILDQRSKAVNKAIANPFAFSQHRLNYILPFSYASNPNTLSATGLNTENVDNIEAKYQISVKLPLLTSDNGVVLILKLLLVVLEIGVVLTVKVSPSTSLSLLNK